MQTLWPLLVGHDAAVRHASPSCPYVTGSHIASADLVHIAACRPVPCGMTTASQQTTARQSGHAPQLALTCFCSSADAGSPEDATYANTFSCLYPSICPISSL
jgi:hypothetical protein